jgi:hypothetical protein
LVIFLFGLEALFTRGSRAQLCVVCSLPQTVGRYWLSCLSNQFLLASTEIKPVYLLFYSLYCVGPGKIMFVNLSSSTFSCTVFLYNVFAFGQPGLVPVYHGVLTEKIQVTSPPIPRVGFVSKDITTVLYAR